MEIIHVVLGKANPERMNGVNKVVYQLALQQTAAGRAVSVWGITADPVHNYPPRPFTTRLFRAFRNKFRVDPVLLKALDEAAGPRVFHLHGGFNPELYAVARQLWKRGLPYVFTPHGAYNTIALQRSRWQKKIYLSLFEMPLLRHAQAVHSLGASEVDGLQRLYPNRKSLLIPYGFEAASVTANGSPEAQKFIIGFCGRIDIYTKGLDLLIQAFAAFAEEHPQAECWIVGDGEGLPRLRQLVEEKGLHQRVILWGARFGQEKDRLMRQFTVFAHPSRNEGLPTAVLEAAGMGIPCVVTRATNTGEAIHQYDAGEVVERPQAKSLFRAFQQLNWRLLSEGTATLSQNARRMIQEEYNWSRIVNQFDRLYTHV